MSKDSRVLSRQRISKCKGPEAGTCPAGLRKRQEVNTESENPGTAESFVRGTCVVPRGSGGLRPWALSRKLRTSSAQQAFAAMGFVQWDLSQNIQSNPTWGWGVAAANSFPESLMACGSNTFHFIPSPVPGHSGSQATEERWEVGAVTIVNPHSADGETEAQGGEKVHLRSHSR